MLDQRPGGGSGNEQYARSIWRSLAIMTRMVAGTLVSIPLGLFHLEGLTEGSWVAAYTSLRPYRTGTLLAVILNLFFNGFQRTVK